MLDKEIPICCALTNINATVVPFDLTFALVFISVFCDSEIDTSYFGLLILTIFLIHFR